MIFDIHSYLWLKSDCVPTDGLSREEKKKYIRASVWRNWKITMRKSHVELQSRKGWLVRNMRSRGSLLETSCSSIRDETNAMRRLKVANSCDFCVAFGFRKWHKRTDE